MKKKYSLLKILVLIVSLVLFSIIFSCWDVIKTWLF